MSDEPRPAQQVDHPIVIFGCPEQALHILADHIHLDVDVVPGPLPSQRDVLLRVIDE